AYILTDTTKHYRTTNRGHSWQDFEVPAGPAFVAEPLSFHFEDKDKILYQGVTCKAGWLGSSDCHEGTWYTTDNFESDPKQLLLPTRQCKFAHSSKEFKHKAPQNLIYCIGWEGTAYSSLSAKLLSSTDFFIKDTKVVTLPGGNKNSEGVLALAIVGKFAVVGVRDLSPSSQNDMLMYISVDAENWAQGIFPHTSSSKLRENAYTVVESTTHSLGVDVLLHPRSAIGTLFVSNSNGTYFVESLPNTNRNLEGFVDFETIYGIEGVGLANVVDNPLEVDGRGAERIVKSVITFDDGSSWAPIHAPSKDVDDKNIGCDTKDTDSCSLHLHSVTSLHNVGRVFSSPAPGYVLGVGSVGNKLKSYEHSDTFLSTDGGVSWEMVKRNAHKYEFGDQGSIMVLINDEEAVDLITYSYDSGKTWQDLDLGVKIRARALTTIPDSTSQKFLLVGSLHKSSIEDKKHPHAAIYLDFSPLRKKKCTPDQFEKWFARTHDHECLMGHKQWYDRKKPDADCYVGDKFTDPIEHEENCACTDADYECDFNYVKVQDKCEPLGPEPIPAGVCTNGDPEETYMGSSGYRLIPGNTCKGGNKKDEKVAKKCSQAQLPEGEISHQTFEFPGEIIQHEYFKDSQTILVRLRDGTIWQSNNEGYTWNQAVKDKRFVLFFIHRYANERAYLLTDTNEVHYTVDTGRTWKVLTAPDPPNVVGAWPIISFHPQESDWLIWVGGADCGSTKGKCRAIAHYSTDNGKKWMKIEEYVKACAWARDTDLKIDRQLILCQSYQDRMGDQRLYTQQNPVQLIEGSKFYKEKVKLFDNVVGFTKFSEYLIVAEYQPEKSALDLQVSLDGKHFALGLFPPSLRLENRAYTILESSTDSVFLHLTISDHRNAEYGHILKSNSNGTFYGLSIENVNRNIHGYVDFEKMIGLDGIALVNVVTNADEIILTGRKKVQSRITHNDGGSWKKLEPPARDSLKQSYECTSVRCALHVHGYTERPDPRATYSTPSVPGLLMAVGNVGEELLPYKDSDTFLSRDGGFTWEEVHKDAHLWEFGDFGSILVMVNDEQATDRVLFSTDEGLNWREYNFGEPMRVFSIVTVPSDTSRKFILFGYYPKSARHHVAVQVDFSSLTTKQCLLDLKNPDNDDFELWSPSEEREEQCLFGRKTLYHRRIRDRNCYVGDQEKIEATIKHNCTCIATDFECEFNYVRDADGNCVLGQGLEPLPNDDSVCKLGEEYWYDHTAYRKIPFSSCDGGERPDLGEKHICPGPKAHGFWFWFFWLCFPFAFCGLAAWYYTRKSGLARGTIRLPDYNRGYSGSYSGAGILETLASIPYYLLGIAGIAWEWVSSRSVRSRRGYRNVPVDEDAQVLRFEDEVEVEE
ncbi:hypothetical protein M422DRAFT_260953, partial [Sphaerobolus stellatus SS14]